MPSPALICTLENYAHVLGKPVFEGKRKKALVPGCGRGVDVLLLQAWGYDVVGLEVSPGAVRAAEEFAKEKEGEEVYRARDEKVGKGERWFVLGDFYEGGWLKEVGMGEGEAFDLIYDYTVSPVVRAWSLIIVVVGVFRW